MITNKDLYQTIEELKLEIDDMKRFCAAAANAINQLKDHINELIMTSDPDVIEEIHHDASALMEKASYRDIPPTISIEADYSALFPLEMMRILKLTREKVKELEELEKFLKDHSSEITPNIIGKS